MPLSNPIDSITSHSLLAPWLEHLLTARLSLLLVQNMRYPAAGRVAQTVVPTDRLIWIKKGALTYQTEKITTHLCAGDFWLVPAWTRRAWQVKSKAGCSMAWVEFVIHSAAGVSTKPPEVSSPELNSDNLPTPTSAVPATHPTPFIKLSEAIDPVTQAMNQLLLLTQTASTTTAPQPLLAEMQLKWLLAQVVHQGSDPRPVVVSPAVGDHGLSELINFIHHNLHRPHLLAELPDHASLSPGRLRTRFAKATGQSPGRYIQSLRMQRARYLLLTTNLSVKEIAVKTGYDDPLYFSRRYRTYWGRPATLDRAPSP